MKQFYHSPLTTLPRSFTYAGVDFTVLDGRLTNRNQLDPDQTTDQFRAELNIEGKNMSGFKADLRIPANVASIQLTVAADGNQPQQITLR